MKLIFLCLLFVAFLTLGSSAPRYCAKPGIGYGIGGIGYGGVGYGNGGIGAYQNYRVGNGYQNDYGIGNAYGYGTGGRGFRF